MKKIFVVLALASLSLTACKMPHSGEHCVSYVHHTHVTTDSKHHVHVTTSTDCVQWVKDKNS